MLLTFVRISKKFKNKTN